MSSANVRSKVMVDSQTNGSAFVYSLVIGACIACGSLYCTVVIMSFLVLRSSHWRKESWLLDFYCLLGLMLLLLFFASSSRYFGLVYGV